MAEINACKLFIDPNSMLQTKSAIEETMQHINTAFVDLAEADIQLHDELRGDLTDCFQNVAQYIETHVKKTGNTLLLISEEMQQYTERFTKINENAEQLAGGNRK